MGDIIHAMVALQYIKHFNKDIEIDWFVEKAFKGVLENNPDINNIIDINLKQIKREKLSIFSQIKKIKSYKKNKYDLVIDAQGLIKSAIVSKLLAKNIAGFSKESTREGMASYFYNKKVEIAYDENAIKRNVKVISNALDFEISEKDILDKKAFLYYENEESVIYEYLSKEKKNIIFVIGASWESKKYSKEQFVKLINLFDDNCLIVWGNEIEKESALYIASHTKAKVLPKITLNSLKALISKSELLIGNDTGPTHIAWALNIPSITLFGNTPGYRNTYLTKINKIIESESIVNPLKLDKNDFSISDISEVDIFILVKKLLANV
ncbi:MAG: lipopolysaccharide heptosyltransferase I [Campylobacteraceae bacterium]|nr:lipopolysaccharide heptosyltransferase I [Campylobacteraceae bacterium]